MREFRDKVAVVTGAASGIGLALTETFVNEGMHVVMADIDEQALTVQAQRLGESVRPVVTDVSDQTSVERAGQLALDAFGALHVAVNNAGIVNGGNFLGALARGMASRARYEPLGCHSRRAGLRSVDPGHRRGGPYREHVFDGCGPRRSRGSGRTRWRSTACSV